VKRLHLVWLLGRYQPRGWLDPRRGIGYDFRRPELYMDCARALERGSFDGVLFADQQAIDDTYTGGIGAALRGGYEGLCGDPLVLLAFMGAVTNRIGLAATPSTTFHPPQLNALDHLTDGRAGWNVVTSARPGDGDIMAIRYHRTTFDMTWQMNIWNCVTRCGGVGSRTRCFLTAKAVCLPM
jgi:long-chain alkane monooxygenase